MRGNQKIKSFPSTEALFIREAFLSIHWKDENLMQTKITHKIEKWGTLFEGMPEFRCDVRTMIVRVSKLSKEVEVEQQFWFHTVRIRRYRSTQALKWARRLYKLISDGNATIDCGQREDVIRFSLWFNMKVYS